MKNTSIRNIIMREISFITKANTHYQLVEKRKNHLKVEKHSNDLATSEEVKSRNYIMIYQVPESKVKHLHTPKLYSNVEEVEVEDTLESTITDRKYYTLNLSSKKYKKAM